MARAGHNVGTYLAEACVKHIRNEDHINKCVSSLEASLREVKTHNNDNAHSFSTWFQAYPEFEDETIEPDVFDNRPGRASKRLTAPQKVVKPNADGWEKLEELAKTKQGLGPFDLPLELRKEIMRIHVNLNHTKKPEFLRSMKHAGAKLSVLRWIKDHFTCPTCEATPKPSSARPALLPKCLSFNKIVGVDCMFYTFEGKRYTLLNMVCWGTNKEVVAIVPANTEGHPTALECRKIFMESWTRPYGFGSRL